MNKILLTLSFCWLEIKRSCREKPLQHIIIPLLIAIALQIVVEVEIVGTESNKWLFFALIFTFWLSLNFSVRLIAKEKRIIGRFRGSGLSAFSILLSKCVVLIVVSIIYSSIFYTTFIYKVINDEAVETKINEKIYTKEKLIEWSNLSKWSTQSNAIAEYKINTGKKWKENISKTNSLFFVINNQIKENITLAKNETYFSHFFYLFLVLFLSSVSGGIIGLMISAICSLQLAVKLVPFITIFQILFSKYFIELGRTPSDITLFESFDNFFQGYWHHTFDLLSVFTCIRYLYCFALKAIEIEFSWQNFGIYIGAFIFVPLLITFFKLKTIEID